jgi:hypothetical protein
MSDAGRVVFDPHPAGEHRRPSRNEESPVRAKSLPALLLLPWVFLGGLFPAAAPGGAAAPPARSGDRPPSHPPLRPAPPPSDRPLADGPAFFADPRRGDDGGKDTPWRSINHAVRHLKPGATLYLRGGTYYEHVVVSRAGRDQAPITVRSFPGEQAVLDGGFREFFEDPAEAWEPFGEGGGGEYRSKRAYPNLRDVLGAFGDSRVGLHTYHHARDLRAANELWDWEDGADPKTIDIKPLYCGPGLWYDRDAGRIHVRLAHTHVPDVANYRGPTDPRKLPLVVAPFRSVPLLLDGARHVRFQDLVVRGGGYDTVVLRQCADVEFDNVTVWCGTYGMRVVGTHRLRLHRCALHGSVPPWSFRADTSLRSYPGRPYRDLTRFGTHALLVPEAGREFEVFALPINDEWEIAYCDFTDAHDGVYLGGINLRFHHNRVLDLQDDGIYLSPMYARTGRGRAEVHLYQNYVGRCLTALAFGGPEKVTEDTVFLYRNVIDLREPVPVARPSSKQLRPRLAFGTVMGDHGSPPWSTMRIYQNTFLTRAARRSDMGLLGAPHADRPRRVFNNLLLHLTALPRLTSPDPDRNAWADGNLYGAPGLEARRAAGYFAKYRSSPAFEQSKKVYPPGFDRNSLAADPRLVKVGGERSATDDYRLQAGSPAVAAGVELPADWPDPLRRQDKGRPDIGALPLGAPPLRAGPAAAPLRERKPE